MQRKPLHMNDRSQIADFISPDNGYRGRMQRLGHQPKNHMRDNLRELRQLEEKVREEREEANRPKEQYKLSQFRDVSSRVYDHISTNDNGESNKEYLPKGASERRLQEMAIKRKQERAALERQMEEARMEAAVPVSPRKSSVPRAEEVAQLAPRSNVNFITKNKYDSKILSPRKKNETVEETFHEEFGKVPQYLKTRKAKQEELEEERRKNAPDPKCPPGMKLMPEQERQSTLEVLLQNREEAIRQIAKLPFIIETPSQIRKKSELESKLKEIEKAIDIFSKPKVFVQM